MEKLTSNTDFVLKHKNHKGFKSEYERLLYYFNIYKSHAHFLKQKLELWIFVPCKFVEGVWVVLKDPKRWNEYLEFPESFDGNKEWYEFYEYQEAKDRVLFEGCVYDDEMEIVRSHDGKDLFYIPESVIYTI